MSRGVKDLRDLICISRLTIRDDDDDDPIEDPREFEVVTPAQWGTRDQEPLPGDPSTRYGDEEPLAGDPSRHGESVSSSSRASSLESSGVEIDSTENMCSPDGRISADSGLVADTDIVKETTIMTKSKRKRQRKKKNASTQKAQQSADEIVTLASEQALLAKEKSKFAAFDPLPSIDSNSPESSNLIGSHEHSTSSSPNLIGSQDDIQPMSRLRDDSRHVTSPDDSQIDAGDKNRSHYAADQPYYESDRDFLIQRPQSALGQRADYHVTGFFDPLLKHLNEDIVSDWIMRANENRNDLSTWATRDNNFIDFANFWLSAMPHDQRQGLLQMEFSIVIDELTLGFSDALEKGLMTRADLGKLFSGLFSEYPRPLLTFQGATLFLTYLDILSSGRAVEFRRILCKAKVSTRSKAHAQLMLAVRSFGVINIWRSVVNFYIKFHHSEPADDSRHISRSSDSIEMSNGNNDVHHFRLTEAIRLGYVQVVHFVLKSGRVTSLTRDAQLRTLIFQAANANQPRVLKYLLQQVKPPFSL